MKVKDGVTEKWYVKWGWVGIVNEWWCLWKQQHSPKFDAQSWVSSTSSLIHSSLTFFTSIISLSTLHFKSYFFFVSFSSVGFEMIHFFCQNKAVIYNHPCKMALNCSCLHQTSNVVEILPRSQLVCETPFVMCKKMKRKNFIILVPSMILLA